MNRTMTPLMLTVAAGTVNVPFPSKSMDSTMAIGCGTDSTMLDPVVANRYRPFSVSRVHVGSCSFSSAYPGSTVMSPTVMPIPIPIAAHSPTRCMLVLLSYGMYKICVHGTSRPFRDALQPDGLQEVPPHKGGNESASGVGTSSATG